MRLEVSSRFQMTRAPDRLGRGGAQMPRSASIRPLREMTLRLTVAVPLLSDAGDGVKVNGVKKAKYSGYQVRRGLCCPDPVLFTPSRRVSRPGG